jgi:HlyD family secretion protein
MKSLTTYPLYILALFCLTNCDQNTNDFDATGAFEATEIIVSSEAIGKIMALNIQEGSQLEAGAYAGYIDSTQLYLRKMQLSAGLKAVDIRKPDIRKQIAVLEQQIATARTEQQRMKNLVEAKAGNQKQLDDITNNIQFLQKQLDAQRSTLDKTSAGTDAEAESLLYQIMQLDDQLQKCRIINPQTGTVLVKYAEAGEVATAGKPLYKIADTNLLYLRAYITASQLSQLKIGQTVKIFADYGRDERRKYPGTITWISNKAEFTPKGIQTKDERANLVYAIKIAVENDGYLKIGQYGRIKL